MSGLPLHGVKETLLSPEPQSAVEGLAHALAADVKDRAVLGARLRDVVAAHPAFLEGWAYLAQWALDVGDLVAAYAFARTGYHRGLDRIRKAGWGGQGPVPWRHEPNRGFLRSVHALMRAAVAIGEREEAERCRDFLLQLDPDDALGMREVKLGAQGS
jgi:uncharacterized protein DUF3151